VWHIVRPGLWTLLVLFLEPVLLYCIEQMAEYIAKKYEQHADRENKSRLIRQAEAHEQNHPSLLHQMRWLFPGLPVCNHASGGTAVRYAPALQRS
jgi:hypothetical protein